MSFSRTTFYKTIWNQVHLKWNKITMEKYFNPQSVSLRHDFESTWRGGKKRAAFSQTIFIFAYNVRHFVILSKVHRHNVGMDDVNIAVSVFSFISGICWLMVSCWSRVTRKIVYSDASKNFCITFWGPNMKTMNVCVIDAA